MCNQSNRWARRQRRVTSWPGSLKACQVQPASASRNEASSSRDAGSMALRRSVSFPQGTMITYITWDVPLQELELRRKTLGERDVHATRLANPCLVWKSTAMAREQKSQGWLANLGHRQGRRQRGAFAGRAPPNKLLCTPLSILSPPCWMWSISKAKVKPIKQHT